MGANHKMFWSKESRRILIAIVALIVFASVVIYFASNRLSQPISQEAQGDISFNVLYPPTPSSFDCNPYAGDYDVQEGVIIRTYEQWENLYNGLLKGCSTKTIAPQIIDFNEQMLIAVFAGRLCVDSNVDVKGIYEQDGKIVIKSITTISDCTLPSFSYPFTLIDTKQSKLPIDFEFETVENSSESF